MSFSLLNLNTPNDGLDESFTAGFESTSLKLTGDTDEITVKKALLALQRSGYASLQSLTVTAVDGKITLHGSVPTYFLKQIAQEVVRAVSGGNKLSNRVSVRSTANPLL
jgi:osmotically-inducible protein OsmY